MFVSCSCRHASNNFTLINGYKLTFSKCGLRKKVVPLYESILIYYKILAAAQSLPLKKFNINITMNVYYLQSEISIYLNDENAYEFDEAVTRPVNCYVCVVTNIVSRCFWWFRLTRLAVLCLSWSFHGHTVAFFVLYMVLNCKEYWGLFTFGFFRIGLH